MDIKSRENNRENNYDLLRLISCMAVIVNHSFGVPPEQMEVLPVWYIGGLLTYFAVPCFFMMSGAFLLDEDRNINFSYFYKRNLAKMIRCYITIVIFLFIYTCICAYRFDQFYQITVFIKNLLKGMPAGVLWYMTVLVMIYLAVPLLVYLRIQIKLGQFAIVAVGILIIGMVCEVDPTVYYSVGQLKYVSYFMLGYVIKKYLCKVCVKLPQISAWGGYCILAIAALGGLFYIYGMYHWGFPSYYAVWTYFSIFLVPYSILVFIGFGLLKVKHSIYLAQYTFPIYCVHTYALGKFKYHEYVSNFYLNKWVIAGLSFCLALLIAIVHRKLYHFFRKKLKMYFIK